MCVPCALRGWAVQSTETGAFLTGKLQDRTGVRLFARRGSDACACLAVQSAREGDPAEVQERGRRVSRLCSLLSDLYQVREILAHWPRLGTLPTPCRDPCTIKPRPEHPLPESCKPVYATSWHKWEFNLSTPSTSKVHSRRGNTQDVKELEPFAAGVMFRLYHAPR